MRSLTLMDSRDDGGKSEFNIVFRCNSCESKNNILVSEANDGNDYMTVAVIKRFYSKN